MRTVEMKLYRFEELEPAAQIHACKVWTESEEPAFYDDLTSHDVEACISRWGVSNWRMTETWHGPVIDHIQTRGAYVPFFRNDSQIVDYCDCYMLDAIKPHIQALDTYEDHDDENAWEALYHECMAQGIAALYSMMDDEYEYHRSAEFAAETLKYGDKEYTRDGDEWRLAW